MNPDLLRGNLDLILLSILEHRPLYGLAIIQEAKARTNGYFDFKEGSLYPALYRLEQEGLLTAERGEIGGHGKPRKYYRLTEGGRERLARKRDEYAAFQHAMRRRTARQQSEECEAEGDAAQANPLRKAPPASAISPPALRTATRPAPKRARLPNRMPLRCSKPVAITKPRANVTALAD